MKEFLVKIERVTLKGEPKQKINQRGEPYTAYTYDLEISAGDDMFLIDKFIMVKEGSTIDEAIKRENLFAGAVGMMKISSSIADYTTKDGKTGRIGRLRIESFTCYNKREEAEAQSMVDAYAQSAAQAAQAAAREEVQAQMAAAQAEAVAPEMPTETVMGDGSGLPF